VPRLIVNADDFGMTAGVTEGIVEAHIRGIVTSTSLMVDWPAAGTRDCRSAFTSSMTPRRSTSRATPRASSRASSIAFAS
jgi:hypothetical protein